LYSVLSILFRLFDLWSEIKIRDVNYLNYLNFENRIINRHLCIFNIDFETLNVASYAWHTIIEYECIILSGICLNCSRNWTFCVVWTCRRYRINSCVGYPVGLNFIWKSNIYVVKDRNLISKNGSLCAYWICHLIVAQNRLGKRVILLILGLCIAGLASGPIDLICPNIFCLICLNDFALHMN
jgi:hypothetical protein